MSTPQSDPIKLVAVATSDVALLAETDRHFVGTLLAAEATGDTNARNALFAWAAAYLEPRFHRYQSWATAIALDNYSSARLSVVGQDGFAPVAADRGAGVESFTAWMLRHARSGATLSDLLQQGAELRTMGAYNDTMQTNALNDPASKGWIRVAEPGACAFCLMLASRGAYGILYRTKSTANFRAHTPRPSKSGKLMGGTCRCHAMPVWSGGVTSLGVMPEYAKDSPFAAYAKDAAVFMDSNGAQGLVAA